MDLKALAESLLGAVNAPVNYGANVNDTATNTQVTQNIRNLGSLTQQGDFSGEALKALGAGANEQASQDEAAAKLAAQRAAEKAKAEQEEVDRLSNPDNYKSIINDVGGYDFFDPDGNKISAVDYARKKNMQLVDVYKNSQDPNDKDFIDDYNAITELGKIVQSGDKKARDAFYKKHPDIKEAYGNSTYEEIVNDLRAQYPGYFRGPTELNRDNIAGVSPDSIQDPEPEDERNKLKRSIDQVLPSLFGLGNTSTFETQKTSQRSKDKKKK